MPASDWLALAILALAITLWVSARRIRALEHQLELRTTERDLAREANRIYVRLLLRLGRAIEKGAPEAV